jgi:hypothetical protein
MAQNLQRDARMLTNKNLFLTGTFFISAAILLGGCTTEKTTDTARSATEQLLLSTATDHALQSASFGIFANRKVFLDATYFDSYDPKYALGTIRDALSRAGAILQDNVTNSDIVIEARAGALATDNSESIFGLPSIGVPVPLAGTVSVPEIAFYKSDKKRAVAKIALLAFARESRAHIYSSGPLDGKSYDKDFRFLFIAWIRTDVPEKYQDAKDGAKFQTWFPQYDLTNLPPEKIVETNSPGTNSISLNHETNSVSTNSVSKNPISTNAPSATP